MMPDQLPKATDERRIRAATEADLPRIVEIYNASIPGRLATADLEPVTVAERRDWFARHDPQSYPLLVMQHSETISGWLGLSHFYGRPAYRATAEVSLYVAPEFQRQGVGRSLLQYTLDFASQLGFQTLLAYVFGHNEPSIRLFESFHFEQWGWLPGVAEVEGIELDLAILGLRCQADR